jgi:hypothetical protein
MDPRQFDRMAKALGSGVQRRHILGVLAGGFAAALSTQRATLAHHKASHCAHEGEVPDPRTKKSCCPGLVPDPTDPKRRCIVEVPPPALCPAFFDPCATDEPPLPACYETTSCFCAMTTEGESFCGQQAPGSGNCASPACTQTTGCDLANPDEICCLPGQTCVELSCCPTNQCVFACGAVR